MAYTIPEAEGSTIRANSRNCVPGACHNPRPPGPRAGPHVPSHEEANMAKGQVNKGSSNKPKLTPAQKQAKRDEKRAKRASK